MIESVYVLCIYCLAWLYSRDQLYTMVKNKEHVTPWIMMIRVLYIYGYTLLGLLVVILVFFLFEIIVTILVTKKIEDASRQVTIFKNMFQQVFDARSFLFLPMFSLAVVAGYSYFVLGWKNLRISDIQVIMYVLAGTSAFIFSQNFHLLR